MEKLNLSISPQDWGTLITKYNADSKKVTLADFTDGTVNADTDITGSITKRPGNVNYNQTLLAAATNDQFEAIFSDGARHLLVVANGEIRYSSGDNIFNSVVNGTGFSTEANFEFATTQDRVYGGNGVNPPIVYDRSVAYGGVAYTAPRVKFMGAQPPGTAPTAAVAAGGAVPVGTHTYKVTFVYYDFEESNGGPASNNAVTSAGNQTVNLTSVPIGGYGVTARKIYRDNNDQLWLHVGTITNNTATTFSDTLAVGVTPTEIPEFNNAPPTFSLITTWLDKQWLGKVPGDPYTLFYTETGMPDIVFPENQLLCNQEDPITAYIVYFGRLVVFNRRSMGQILGTTPDTFRYSAIPSSIGCVDNRSLQIRVIEGVPILIWLSDAGFYSYDGNAINYISDEIEDLVNFNIQQAIQQKNSNTQTSQVQFLSGTASQGIDLTSNPGAITTKGYQDGTSVAGTNPRRNLDDQGDWESGLQITNLALKAGDNLLKQPVSQTLNPINTGVVTGDMLTAPLRLPTSTNHTGGGGLHFPFTAYIEHPAGVTAIAKKFTAPRAGQLTGFTVSVRNFDFATPHNFKLTVWSDSSGSPNAILFQGPSQVIAGNGNIDPNISCSVNLATNQVFWIGIEKVGGGTNISVEGALFGTLGVVKEFKGGAWVQGTTGLNNVGELSTSYTFNATPIPRSGTWTSNSYNTNSATLNQVIVDMDGTFPATFPTKTFNFIVEASNDNISFSQIFTTATRADLSGQSISVSGQRYYRFKVTLATTDDRSTDSVTSVTIRFQTSVDWISPVIDTTADSTIYNALTVTSSAPSGTSVAVAIATSADNISYTSFVSFGSHVVQRYAKIRITLSRSNGAITASVSSIVFKWTIVANLISQGIDTGVTPPAGWDIFLASFNTNGGSVSFQMRSATTLGGLTAATFQNVTNGEFPSLVTPLQFVQWKVIITSADNDVPVVDSVTIQWFISLVNSIRPASIFVDSKYFIALAELDQSTNNILLELDSDGKWRRHRGLNISTFSYFFNRPYFGLATEGRIRKFLEGLTDAGTNIELDVRFKASDYSTQYQNHASKVKVVGEVILRGINTGATFQLFYSVDMGDTFIPMLTSEGASSYVSSTDGQNFYVRFRPTWDGSNPIAGRTILYRVYSNDEFAVEINGLDATAFLRTQAPVVTG